MIKSDFSIGGFSGSTGMDTVNVRKKRVLLEAEGLKFDDLFRLAKSEHAKLHVFETPVKDFAAEELTDSALRTP